MRAGAFFSFSTNQHLYVVIPTDATRVAPAAAVKRVERELIMRENQIITDMLGISGLIVYAQFYLLNIYSVFSIEPPLQSRLP